MHSGLRKILAGRDLAVMRYCDTARARRARLLHSQRVDLLLDIGANVGQYALDARASGYAGRIISFEPLAGPFAELAVAADRDPRWTCERSAVGSEPGELTMQVSENSVFSSALPATSAMTDADPAARAVSTEVVPVTTLDEVVAGVATTGRFAVKIDVQGFEGQVLAGGAEALSRAALVEVEMALTPVYDGQIMVRDVVNQMYEDGFELANVENLMPDYATGRALQINGIFVRPQPSP